VITYLIYSWAIGLAILAVAATVVILIAIKDTLK
jgi:hypothetical protein